MKMTQEMVAGAARIERRSKIDPLGRMRRIRIGIPVTIGNGKTQEDIDREVERTLDGLANFEEYARILKTIYVDLQKRPLTARSRVPLRGMSYATLIRNALKRAKDWP